MGQTAAEKILSRVCGRSVSSAEVIYPEPDLITIHDHYLVHAARVLDELEVKALHVPQKVLFYTDHEPLAASRASAERQKRNREICDRYAIGHVYGPGRGGHGHIFPMEVGLVSPGDFVLGYDLHTPNFGALGALGFYMGPEIVEVMACGSAWLKVPETILVRLHGSLPPGVTVRDVAQRLIADIDPALMDYALVEYEGPALDAIDLDGRMTLCNTPLESTAKSAFVRPNSAMLEWARQRALRPFTPVFSDADAQYRAVIEFDVALAEPQIAVPPRADNVVGISALAGKAIQHAYIGSCANGGISDLRAAASILRGRRVARNVRLIVTPGTQEIASRAAREGLLEIFSEAGAMVSPPGCGVCAAGLIAPLASGEVSINTGTVNEPGRLGAKDAEIYLASPLTVAASAVSGCISDPREFL
jgi:3-isopropylmalate/(R)-2-methylmalate dehydratase large subunit